MEITFLESQELINFELTDQKHFFFENLRKHKPHGHLIKSRANYIHVLIQIQ